MAFGYLDPRMDTTCPFLPKVFGQPSKSPAPAADTVSWEFPDAVPEVDFDGVIGVEAAVWCETIQDEADLNMMRLLRFRGARLAAAQQRGVGGLLRTSGAQGPL